jgi:hypothetical protein
LGGFSIGEVKALDVEVELEYLGCLSGEPADGDPNGFGVARYYLVVNQELFLRGSACYGQKT